MSRTGICIAGAVAMSSVDVRTSAPSAAAVAAAIAAVSGRPPRTATGSRPRRTGVPSASKAKRNVLPRPGWKPNPGGWAGASFVPSSAVTQGSMRFESWSMLAVASVFATAA